MFKVLTDCPGATAALGREIAPRLMAGDVICLSGDLGAGKTLFVQGIAAGLGVVEGVTSPTFTILQVYETGRLPVYHFDLYRLEHPDELLDIGFEEYMNSDGVTVIEWADKFSSQMPDESLSIELKIGSRADERVLTVTPCGARYQKLCEELKEVADACIRHGHTGV